MAIKNQTTRVKLVMANQFLSIILRALNLLLICTVCFFSSYSLSNIDLSTQPLVEIADNKANTALELLHFSSPKNRQRYYSLIAELRCPKCQNQNLSDSDAPIASDLRSELHLLINDGYSDADILSFMQSRYGDFVLYAPPVNSVTAILWLLPAVLGLLAIFIVAMIIFRNQETALITEVEKKQVEIEAETKTEVRGDDD